MHSSRIFFPSSGKLALLASAAAAALLAGCASAPSEPISRPAESAAGARAATAPAPPGKAALDDADVEQRFARWVADFRAAARSQGVSEATLRSAFDQVRYLPRVIELDRAQPEFTRTVWDYLDNAVTPQRVATGQEKLAQVRAEADAAAARYGVPPAVVVAIWGMESNYGDNYGNTPVVDALATLGFEGRREDWARRELLAALKILDSGDIARDRMIGSWAGAMGQTQFLPSNFLAYAVDADGDGRRDIWGSMADVVASTANFLSRSGWQAGTPWGVEVRLPTGFDFGRADMAVRQSGAQWAAEGLRTVDGQPLPELADASVLLPAGARGPAFLVLDNFRSILKYNNSTSYALAIGLLADNLLRPTEVQGSWPRGERQLGRSERIELQELLARNGLQPGPADGIIGANTRKAVRALQLQLNWPADGYPNEELLKQLRGR